MNLRKEGKRIHVIASRAMREEANQHETPEQIYDRIAADELDQFDAKTADAISRLMGWIEG